MKTLYYINKIATELFELFKLGCYFVIMYNLYQLTVVWGK